VAGGEAPRAGTARTRGRAGALSERRTAPEYYQLAENYGITIVDDWIEELERTHRVKL
jgi:hypothetical protein